MHADVPAERPGVVGRPLSVQVADSVLSRHSPEAARWHYEQGLILRAIEQVWRATGEPAYWRFVKDTMDLFIGPDGDIRSYRVDEYNLDQIKPGVVLFPLLEVTGEERYRHAIMRLRRQLDTQPRTRSGGFWHKQIYPHQMWLDGIYMAAPFYAAYGRTFDEPAVFDDVAHQIILIEQHTRDPASGLLYHAWDESRQQRWANPETGCSPHFWGRAMGWYAMALVDVLGFFPPDHPRRAAIIAILELLAGAITRVQDEATGLWYQVLDQGGRPGNYLEASASCMFVYALAKGVRRGYLPAEYLAVARRGYDGIERNLITVDAQGLVSLHGICSVAGLGGEPYRDGSFEYYVSEKQVSNDYKGVGPLILAALEVEGA
ncbi:MAG TPA: glycoside hydrolase family 88 protein [Herpetosiphonaceae bacterium]|nr:glycoside hydrolase family 88 protein [Herpetosiphonaceae bacterium]